MPRNLPGTITREAPPGPTMTEAQFLATMRTFADDAARWRWLRSNWSAVIVELVEVPVNGAELQALVDKHRAAV